jgi:hypothetical protein
MEPAAGCPCIPWPAALAEPLFGVGQQEWPVREIQDGSKAPAAFLPVILLELDRGIGEVGRPAIACGFGRKWEQDRRPHRYPGKASTQMSTVHRQNCPSPFSSEIRGRIRTTVCRSGREGNLATFSEAARFHLKPSYEEQFSQALCPTAAGRTGKNLEC